MFDSLLNSQSVLLLGNNLKKNVTLGDEQEIQLLNMDSTSWNAELGFLEEINPNQPEYRGAFNESDSGRLLELQLNANEKASLKKLSLEQLKGKIAKINATIHEDKDVYVHHQEIEINLFNGKITSYSIDGYQKLLFKDTIKFRIQGEVL